MKDNNVNPDYELFLETAQKYEEDAVFIKTMSKEIANGTSQILSSIEQTSTAIETVSNTAQQSAESSEGITSDGKTLVVTVNALAIIDLSTDKVDKVAVGKGPAQVYIEPDDKYAFVANQGTEDAPSNTVSKIDMSTKKVVATIETGKGAHGVVVSTDNKYVYVTNMYDGTVSVIDNSTDKVIKNTKVEGEPNGISYR